MADQPQPLPLEFPPVHGDVQILPVRIIDGDTFEFCYLIKGVGRLWGLNCAELHGPDHDKAVAAAKRLGELLPTSIMHATLMGRDKYGERVDIVVFDANGKSLNAQMIAEGFAKKWDGKGPRPT